MPASTGPQLPAIQLSMMASPRLVPSTCTLQGTIAPFLKPQAHSTHSRQNTQDAHLETKAGDGARKQGASQDAPQLLIQHVRVGDVVTEEPITQLQDQQVDLVTQVHRTAGRRACRRPLAQLQGENTSPAEPNRKSRAAKPQEHALEADMPPHTF